MLEQLKECDIRVHAFLFSFLLSSINILMWHSRGGLPLDSSVSSQVCSYSPLQISTSHHSSAGSLFLLITTASASTVQELHTKQGFVKICKKQGWDFSNVTIDLQALWISVYHRLYKYSHHIYFLGIGWKYLYKSSNLYWMKKWEYSNYAWYLDNRYLYTSNTSWRPWTTQLHEDIQLYLSFKLY